jgi:hypothetical protein
MPAQIMARRISVSANGGAQFLDLGKQLVVRQGF